MEGYFKPNKKRLIYILQHAYSGEKAAALAYCGHWKSVKDLQEKKSIQKIENDEWEHREKVGLMLEALGAKPKRILDFYMGFIGRLISFACYITGWFFPMYFAGRIESKNTLEYEEALFHMSSLDFPHLKKELHEMSQIEKEHEIYFLEKVKNHPWLPIMKKIFKWG